MSEENEDAVVTVIVLKFWYTIKIEKRER